DDQLSADARARRRPRRVLVGPVVGVRRVSHEPAPRAPARGGHQLLGPVQRRRHRGRAAGRVLDHAFGAILAAFDTGIGTGSTTVGWLIQRFGFSTAFGVAAALSAISLPYFVVVDRRL